MASPRALVMLDVALIAAMTGLPLLIPDLAAPARMLLAMLFGLSLGVLAALAAPIPIRAEPRPGRAPTEVYWPPRRPRAGQTRRSHRAVRAPDRDLVH